MFKGKKNKDIDKVEVAATNFANAIKDIVDHALYGKDLDPEKYYRDEDGIIHTIDGGKRD